MFLIRTSKMSDAQFAAFLLTHPISGAKGDSSASNTEKAQAGFTNTLQQTFVSNNAAQQKQLQFLTQQLEQGINNPQGYSPQTLAVMRTQATEAGDSNNAKVMQAVQEKNALQGGASPTALPNGVQAQIQAGVANQEAQNESNAQLGITQQEGQLEVENRNRDIAALEGTAQIENHEGMASGATGAANSVSGLSQAVTQANGPGSGSILGGVVGAGLGAAGSMFKGAGGGSSPVNNSNFDPNEFPGA